MAEVESEARKELQKEKGKREIEWFLGNSL
jgi:hypothetical protein